MRIFYQLNIQLHESYIKGNYRLLTTKRSLWPIRTKGDKGNKKGANYPSSWSIHTKGYFAPKMHKGVKLGIKKRANLTLRTKCLEVS